MPLGRECGGYEANIAFDVPSVGERPFDNNRNAEIVAPHQTFALLCLVPVCAHVAYSADHISPHSGLIQL